MSYTKWCKKNCYLIQRGVRKIVTLYSVEDDKLTIYTK
jgi:hypothetical protein